jgi:sn-glycerol 3-phosphate transport system ATP-binding protein
MAEVVLRDLRKRYPGGIDAVRGVSLSVPDGALCVLVGPSGCGKSTLLRMVAGLETVSEGEVEIGGRVVNDIEPADRDIAMVFQNYALYPHMTVYDNIAYGLRNRGTPKPEIDARVREAARILAIEELLGRKPAALSGGQRQRVAMGRAIVRKPQVFLFDEPLSNLDAQLRGQMRVEIRRLQRALGVTSVYVTHDQVEAMTLADLLVVLRGGVIEQIGTPGEVYRRPATRFVGTFIGSPPMNILPGIVREAGLVAVGDHALAAPGWQPLAPGSEVDVGLRPEDLSLAPAAGSGTLPLAVDLVEDLGATRLLHGVVARTPFVVQLPAAAVPTDITAVHLAVPSEALHLFDRATGARLPAASGPDARLYRSAAG